MARRIKNIEDNEDVFWYYAEVLNPLSYLDSFILNPSREKMAAKTEHALVAGTIFSATAFSGWALSGGGAGQPMWFNTLRPGAREVWAVKQHIYKTAVSSASNVVRQSFKIVPGLWAAALGAGIVHAGDAVLDYLTGGYAGILPDVNFMKFTEY